MRPENTIVASGVGQHQMYTSQFWKFNEPYTWVNSGGLGTMGFSIPAAIGAKAAKPDHTVWAVDGDGCFQMTAQELVTSTVERLPIKVALLNNSYLGMVRQWQEMFYDERYSEVFLNGNGARLRDVGRVDGLRRHPRRVARGGRPGDREGELDQRPLGRRRVPHRGLREGVPDGPRRTQQRRPDPAPDPARPGGSVAVMSKEPLYNTPSRSNEPIRHHILSVLVQNRAGVLARVASLFARRGFNIFSLAVAPAEEEGMSRITIVVDVQSTPLEQVTKQLFKLIDVIKISELDPRRSVERELLIATVKAPDDQRGHVVELVNIFEGKIIAVAESVLTVSLDGHPDKLNDFEDLLDRLWHR